MGTRLFVLPIALATVLSAADVAPGMNHFTVAAYKEVARGKGNLILSPFSIASVLSMAFEGARGQTADQMASVLHRLNGAEYPAEFASMVAQMIQEGNAGANQLAIANGLWVQRGFSILPDFQHTLAEQYHAPLQLVDFHSPQTVDEINAWTEQHTKGRIKNLFGPHSLGAKDRLVLTSAIYFYGKWQTPFKTKDTHPAPFRLGPGGTVDTNFMHQSGTFEYSETPTAQILQMHYAGTPMVFDIVLPKSDDGITALDTSITADDLANWLGDLATRTVDVTVPKFRAESEFSMAETLARMGMPVALTGSADFSGINGQKDIAISAVKHKAFVDVSEEGTEAAAATGMVMTRIAARQTERVIFKADHPFLFFIRDSHSGTILFTGRMSNPKPS